MIVVVVVVWCSKYSLLTSDSKTTLAQSPTAFPVVKCWWAPGPPLTVAGQCQYWAAGSRHQLNTMKILVTALLALGKQSSPSRRYNVEILLAGLVIVVGGLLLVITEYTGNVAGLQRDKVSQ